MLRITTTRTQRELRNQIIELAGRAEYERCRRLTAEHRISQAFALLATEDIALSTRLARILSDDSTPDQTPAAH
ncbi:hypothetical protein ACFC0K_36355 [Streptomyces hydrogenans]|uniref:hypothetical protein n=1 Tax=Streptomyces hydrogenans TaxID=1873719 RepID=UPI0035D5C4E3